MTHFTGNALMYQLLYDQANAKSHGFVQFAKFDIIHRLIIDYFLEFDLHYHYYLLTLVIKSCLVNLNTLVPNKTIA